MQKKKDHPVEAKNTKTYVPINVKSADFDNRYTDFIEILKNAGVSRVYLCVGTCYVPDEAKNDYESRLRRYIPIFEKAGFEVGVWMSSLGHGGAETAESHDDGFALMQSSDGMHNTGGYCPLDENFTEAFRNWLKRVAAAGARLIMLDDDYRMAFRGGKLYCCCDRHRALIEERLGTRVAREELGAVFSGEPSRLRDAWLYAQGEGLRRLAQRLRQAVDSVSPGIRLGHCAVLSTWELDGIDSIELARIFAGQTRPFLRLIGAPYWTALRNFNAWCLSTVIEYERMQAEWCANIGGEIEIFSEGDVFPRPRWKVPAAYLELFDAGLRASGGFDGILKYMCDYTSLPEFEPGYLARHNRNAGRRKWIAEHFDGKKAIGLSLFEPVKTIHLSRDAGEVHNRCIPASLRLAAFNTLPSKFTPGGVTVIYGDSAELAADEQLKDGAVIDAAAARILARRGFDVGALAFGESIHPGREHFGGDINDSESVTGRHLKITTKANATVLSHVSVGEERWPGAFTYEDAAGHRFLVHSCFARDCCAEPGVFYGHYRQKILIKALEWVGRAKLPVVCEGNPHLYIIAKRGKDSLSAALLNLFCDEAIAPRLSLDRPYANIESFGCDAVVDGNIVRLSDIGPYGFAAFTVRS